MASVSPWQEFLDALAGGMSVHEACRTTGIKRSRAVRYVDQLNPPRGICKCGKPSSHSGRCWARRGETEEPFTSRRFRALQQEIKRLRARIAELTK